jgi:hypothetical protein
MALTAAQYKSNFDDMQTKAAGTYGTAPDRSVAYSQIGSIWAYLYIEQSRIDKQGFTPSADAMTYRTNAENILTQAASDAYSGQAQKAVARAQAASNHAYTYVEQVRVDNQVVVPT